MTNFENFENFESSIQEYLDTNGTDVFAVVTEDGTTDTITTSDRQARERLTYLKNTGTKSFIAIVELKNITASVWTVKDGNNKAVWAAPFNESVEVGDDV